MARYTITGALDSTFNHTGIVTTSFAPDQQGHRVAIQPDGKIVVVGISNNGTDGGDFTVVRYTPSGALDTAFNLTGIVTTPIGSLRNGEAADVAIQTDGKIVVAGTEGEGENFDDYEANIVVVRYLNHWHSKFSLPVILKE